MIYHVLFKSMAEKILGSQGSNKDSHDKDDENRTEEEEVLVADGKVWERLFTDSAEDTRPGFGWKEIRNALECFIIIFFFLIMVHRNVSWIRVFKVGSKRDRALSSF